MSSDTVSAFESIGQLALLAYAVYKASGAIDRLSVSIERLCVALSSMSDGLTKKGDD